MTFLVGVHDFPVGAMLVGGRLPDEADYVPPCCTNLLTPHAIVRQGKADPVGPWLARHRERSVKCAFSLKELERPFENHQSSKIGLSFRHKSSRVVIQDSSESKSRPEVGSICFGYGNFLEKASRVQALGFDAAKSSSHLVSYTDMQ